MEIDKKYINGLGLELAVNDAEDTQTYVSNHRGDVVALLDGSKRPIANYVYDAYGTEREESFTYNGYFDKFGTDTNQIRYAGQYLDNETGNYYLRARYYSPNMGRFTQEDSVKDGGNWYSYCGGNPVMLVDPLGLKAQGVFCGERTENLSQGAQTYLAYYSQKYAEAKKKYENATTEEERIAAQQEMDEWFAKANDIEELEAQGKVQGKTLAVPAYNQMNTSPTDNTNNLCWATCTAMVASFQLGDTVDRTLEIATAITGSTSVAGYNQPWPWVSTDDPALGLGITEGQTQTPGNLSMADIQTTIDGGTPFGVLYRNETSGHWVVVIGYATAPGHDPLVVSNDPWGGIQSIQTYSDFQTLPDGRTWEWTAR